MIKVLVSLAILLFYGSAWASSQCKVDFSIKDRSLLIRPSENNVTSLILKAAVLDRNLPKDLQGLSGNDKVNKLLIETNAKQVLTQVSQYGVVFQELLKYSTAVSFVLLVVFSLWKVGAIGHSAYRMAERGGEYFVKEFQNYLVKLFFVGVLWTAPAGIAVGDYTPLIANAVRFVVGVGDSLAYSIYYNGLKAFMEVFERKVEGAINAYRSAVTRAYEGAKKEALSSIEETERALERLRSCYTSASRREAEQGAQAEDLSAIFSNRRQILINAKNAVSRNSVAQVYGPYMTATFQSNAIILNSCRQDLVSLTQAWSRASSSVESYNREVGKTLKQIEQVFCDVVKEQKQFIDMMVKEGEPLGWAGNVVLFPIFEFWTIKTMERISIEVEERLPERAKTEGVEKADRNFLENLISYVMYLSVPPGSSIFKVFYVLSDKFTDAFDQSFRAIADRISKHAIFKYLPLSFISQATQATAAFVLTVMVVKFVFMILPLIAVVMAIALRFVSFVVELVKFMLVLPFYAPLMAVANPGAYFSSFVRNLVYFMVYGPLIVISGMFGYFMYLLISFILSLLTEVAAYFMGDAVVGGIAGKFFGVLLMAMFEVLIPIIASINLFRFVYNFPEVALEMLEVRISTVRVVETIKGIEGTFGLPRI